MAAVTTTTTSSAKMPNGVKSTHSQTLDHVISYPLISEALSTIQHNSVGQSAISTFNSLYSTFASPVLPYFQRPYSILEPYLNRVDSFGDSTLNSVDDTFPAVKSVDYTTLQSNLQHLLYLPLHLLGEGREYLVATWQDEYSKTQAGKDDHSLATAGKAVVSTELKIIADAMHAVADFLGPRKQKLEEDLAELKKEASKKLGDLQKKGQDAQGKVEKKGQQAKKEVNGQLNN